MDNPVVVVDEVVAEVLPAEGHEAIPSDVARHVVSGTSTLGASVAVERGTSFLANILAARLAGASTFGAYSLGISTAINISTYAAGGIGATATRFSGKYPYESGSYGTLARALAVVSGVSAVAAAGALSLGSAPIARLLHKPELTGLLHWAALSAAGMIVLECARGFFVGQRRLAALGLLSVTVGVLMISLLPAMAATHHAAWMVSSQGAITLFAVAICLFLAKPLKLLGPAVANGASVPFGPMLREVWGYGLVQLFGLLSANLAGWWVTILVARGDPTLVQMGIFAVASQMRNLTGLVPGLLTEGSFAAMASGSGEDAAVPLRVMAICTYTSTMAALIFASAAVLVAPWGLRLLYGRSYEAAALAVAVGMSVAVLQMGNSPTSARLSIVSIRATAVINTLWAVFTAAAGGWWMRHGGSAAEAMAVFLCGHILMAAQVLFWLHRRDRVPKGLVALFGLSTGGMLALCLLAYRRAAEPQYAAILTLAMAVLVVGLLLALGALGRRHGWLSALNAMGGKLWARMGLPGARRGRAVA